LFKVNFEQDLNQNGGILHLGSTENQTAGIGSFSIVPTRTEKQPHKPLGRRFFGGKIHSAELPDVDN